ncbi:MAG: hypothetical protein IKE28_11885 [Solobacterium sp.]|nr:hypothetical protein [Solobacterium sp.]
MALTTENYGTKIARKLLAHYINVNLTTPAWERIGKDLEDLSIELNAESEDKHNILGEVETVVSSYGATGSVEPYFARKGTDLFTWLQDVIDNRKVLDDLKVEHLEVHAWEEPTGSGDSATYPAYKETAVLVPTSYGGDYNGYQIPFEMHLQGDRVAGTFAPATKTFTANQ